MVEWITKISDWLWGMPMIVILVLGGLYLTVQLGFFQVIRLPHILGQTLMKLFSKDQNKGEGTLTPLQATTSALASTLGAANLVGVPVAIALGGPGAIFWMWLVAFFGISTKYSEVVLGMKYREKNSKGEYVGGPMYYIKKGLGWKKVAWLFAFFLMIEIVASIMVQSNSIAISVSESFSISKVTAGIILAGLTVAALYGGIKSIGKVTEKVIPLFVLGYLITGGIVLAYNFSAVPEAFGLIFKHAFVPMSAVGGFVGAGIAEAIRWGLARGLYSNEAGMGTAPIAHATANNVHPARQGLWGAFEVIIDTMVVSTMTALIVISSGAWKAVGPDQAANMVKVAFTPVFGETFSSIFVTALIFILVMTTVLVITFYGEKQAEFLFGTNFSYVMRVVYIAAIVIGAVGGLQLIWKFLDLLLAFVVIPNMIAVLFLSKEVREITKDYFDHFLKKEKATSKTK